MNIFESIGEKADRATDIGEKYISSSHQYFKLKLFQQLAFSVSLVAKLIAVGAFIFLGLIFAAVAGALKLGELFENLALGYLSVAGIFLIIGLLIYATRKSINCYIIKKMGSKFFSELDD